LKNQNQIITIIVIKPGQEAWSRVSWVNPNQPGKIKKIKVLINPEKLKKIKVLIFYMKKSM
jgi:hypothetical protein